MDVFVVEGDHDTFVQGKSSVKTAAVIDDIILQRKQQPQQEQPSVNGV